MAEYSHKPRKFILGGVDLSRPVDLLDPVKYVLAKNVRGYQDGTITTRPGAAAINASAMAGGAVHSIKRLNDEIGPTLTTPTQAYARMVGAGTKLYSDTSAHTAFTEIASGLSGNPITWCPIRPEQSPQPWMYIHDTAKLLRAKASAAGDAVKSYQWGIAPPTAPLSIALGSPLIKTIDDMEAGTFGGWAQAGAGAGALTNPDRTAAVAITFILFDTGTTGWACVNPAAMGEIREGEDLTLSASVETVKVDSVYKAITTTTIGSIRYDNAPTNTGLCTIQLAAPTAELVMNSMVRIAAAENVRVLSVTYGPDGIPSFRCSTTATRSAGDAVAGLDSFRAYFTNTHAAAETLSGKMLREVTAAAGNTTLTRTVALDLSTFGTRPVLPSDLMVLGLTASDAALITEIQLRLDVDASTNDFTKNYYFKAISPADLTPSVQQTLPQLTVQQRVIQRDQVRASDSLAQKLNMLSMDSNEIAVIPGDVIGDVSTLADSTPSVDQTATGATQWSVVKIPISDLVRVGTDTSRGLKNVAVIQISIIATAIVTVQVDDWYITGGYGADSVLPNSTENAASPYFWTYRYRDGRTGDKSPWAPLNRSGFETSRNRIVLTPTVSADAQVTKIDIARIGGTLNEFRIIGTMGNTGTFNDDFPDDVAAAGQAVSMQDVLNLAQPFPVLDIPRTGTCDVKGTEVTWKTGDKFNVAAMRDSQILINNVPYNLYTNPSTDQQLSILQNGGTQSDVSFFIPDAFLQGQTLDAVFGPSGGADSPLVIFGAKRGTLYWTTGNDPSLSRTNNQVEVTGGSEVLMNGCLYDSRPYVLSNERMFEIVSDGAGGYVTREVANSKGLWSPWGLCVGLDRIYAVCDDGIYESQGGAFLKISQDLGPLLPHDGIAGVTVNGIAPPDFAQPNTHRLEFADGKVKWTFIDTGSVYRTWVYDTSKRGWESLDTYGFVGRIVYQEEGEGTHSELIGGADGVVYQVGGTLDGATAITCALKTGCEDCGETRSQKQFGDVQLDCDTGSVDLTVNVLTNNLVTTSATETINNALRTYELVNIDNGLGVTARNISMDLAWTGYVVLYEWNASYIPRSDLATERTTDWYAPQGGTACWLQGVRIDIDTFGVAKSFQVLGDDDVLIATLSINHNGRIIEPFTWIPVFTHLVRLLPVGETTDFLMYSEPIFVSEPEPELALIWHTQPTTFDWPQFGHVYRAQIAHRSTADVTMVVTIDGTDYSYTIPNSGGEYTKTYVTLQAIKGKSFEFTLTSDEGFRLYKRDCGVQAKSWADIAAYLNATPFGALSRLDGASI